MNPPEVSGATPLRPTRAGLTLDIIVRAGIAFIDQNGVHELTMRRLGATLGVEAMALYHYVPGKEDLIDRIVETVIDDLHGDPQILMPVAVSWQDYLQRLAHGVRRMALTHPEVFPLVATRPAAAPWVRPPLRSVRWVDSFLSSLLQWGFDDRSAVAAYRAFTSFLVGHLLLEVSGLGVDIGPVSGQSSESDIDLGDFPTLERLRSALSRDVAHLEFEASLESLLERLSIDLPDPAGT